MKNIKFNKNRLLSLLTAGMIMATPIAANAENDKDGKDNTSNGFTLVLQQQEQASAPLTMNEYVNGVGESYAYLKQFINYDHMQQDLQCLYYLVNRTYLEDGLENTLVDQGVVYPTDPKNGEYRTFMAATNLIGNINDYNQSVIRNMYESYKKSKDSKKMNSEKLIDVSKFCYDEHDAEIVHSMFTNWFNAYKNNRFPNEYFTEVFKELTTLNSAEGRNNAHSLSVGAKWLAQVGEGRDVKQMLRDDMTEDFKRKELDKYFEKDKLNQAQWILRKDVSLDLNCLKNELEEEVFYFGQLEYWCNTTVNNDIIKSFDKNDCNTKTK